MKKEDDMLTGLLERAVAMGADRIEIEYKDHDELITAFRGPVGLGIGSVDSRKNSGLFGELDKLKKAKRVTLSGQSYRLSFSKYESFGEWAHQIHLKKEDRPRLPAQAKDGAAES